MTDPECGVPILHCAGPGLAVIVIGIVVFVALAYVGQKEK